MSLTELILPKGLLDYFKVTSLEVDPDETKIDIYLEELSSPPISDYTYCSKGFTEAHTIQDFPIRGKAVFLHVKRRKWLEKETNKIITTKIPLTHIGTQLTQEFAAFLKGTH